METLHLYSPSGFGSAPNHNDLAASYRASFAALPLSKYGSPLRPLVLPYHLYGMLLLCLYLLVPHTHSALIYEVRWPVLGVIFWWQWKTLWETTSMSVATAYAAGLVSVLVAVYAVVFLVFERPQWEAWRVERRRRRILNGEAANGAARAEEDEKNIRHANGHTTGHANESGNLKSRGDTAVRTNGNALIPTKGDREQGEYEYYKQFYPTTLLTRISWVSDLLITFRGPGWNWAVPTLPPLPSHIARQVSPNSPITARHESRTSSVGVQRYDTRKELARAILPKFIAGYFLLDTLKVVMMKDPYFLVGPNTYTLPAHLQGFSPLTLHLIRQTISSLAIITSLFMVFSLSPLIHSLVLGPEILGLRGESYYYSTSWGSFSNITTRGLNGLWGGWWHQSFRFVFSSPTNYLIRNGYISPKSSAARIIALIFAFGISGVFHAAGSITQFPPTKPTHLTIFFALQAVGIIIQRCLCSFLSPLINRFTREGPVRKIGNFLFVLFWLLATASWLTDDFARGGVWLYEPVPISPLRGLGFGEKGDGWFCWSEHLGIGWYKGEKWWESGIAL
ncbi:uncharacterized protein RCO7_11205 [Rhynchosporium graminicola]|uniref:Wax synthase domain-containing protein n=1 Tax=Rhynchosporium graminicola TaxID=2792576 RepID=A0A1E1LCK4_9HELO|nr:uncharacterized protein RCO7_11205 [Rhynchosporium commune]